MTENEKDTQQEQKQLSPYLQRENCTEQEVVALIRLGYSLWMITPVTKELRKNQQYVSIETVLLYHFIKKKGA